MENKNKSLFQKIMFKAFSCPLFILLAISTGNYLIFYVREYNHIGYQILVLVALMVVWIRTADGSYKFKMMTTKYE